MTTPTLNKKRLSDCLIVDNIQVPKSLLKKAQVDDAPGFYEIGQIYEDVKKYDKAVNWYRLSASKGHARLQFKLGCIHAAGKGVTVDYKLSMEWYLKAYDNWHTGAANNVGYFYLNGKGVNQDFKLALRWFLNGADSGDDFAQRNIGFIYENGYGVKVDKQYALEWYEKSAEQGHDDAKINVRRLNNQGFYLVDSQKRHIQTERDLEMQKSKNKSLENQLKASEQKKLAFDNEIKLLKQENETLGLKSQLDAKDQAIMKEDIIQQLSKTFSKMIALRVGPDVPKNSNADEDNPENDICYDE